MRRHLLGILGIGSLVGWIAILATHGSASDQWGAAAGICMKVGLTLTAVWLAFPQLDDIADRVAPWMLAVIGIGGLIFIAKPKTILYLGPLLAAIAVLQFVGWLFKPLPNPPAKRRKPSDPPRDTPR